MRRSGVFVAAILLGACGAAWANGGGYTLGYGYTGAVGELVKKGRIFVPAGTAQAQIVSEDLRIDLLTESADVEVRYRIRNDGGARSVDIGFPIEGGGESEFYSDAKVPLEPLGRYEIVFDGKPVESKLVEEPQPDAGKADERRVGVAGWQVSRLHFAAKGEHELSIRYRVAYQQSEFYVSDDGTMESPIFRYRLSTGAVWKGPIARGRVEVRSLRPENDAFVIERPEGKFRRAGSGYVWEFNDLEPTLADDIRIAVRPTVESHEGHYEFVEGRYYYVLNPDKIEASSTLKADGNLKYDAENVRFGEDGNAWTEGVEGDGIGESLTFTFDKPRKIDRIDINPGYAKNEALWAANNRVAKVEITLNGERRFTAELPDEYLKKACFEIPVKDYTEPVRTAKLKILAVHRGAKFDDTCISHVRFVSRLAKKPELRPVR